MAGHQGATLFFFSLIVLILRHFGWWGFDQLNGDWINVVRLTLALGLSAILVGVLRRILTEMAKE